jgi:hypothetical protein
MLLSKSISLGAKNELDFVHKIQCWVRIKILVVIPMQVFRPVLSLKKSEIIISCENYQLEGIGKKEPTS